ncbi:TetR/AcrR family transcriptional regulator [Mycobacterium sp. BMJ-28]
MGYVRESVRRALTSDAAIRVIGREGIGAASLRRIAEEAEVPLSSLNHVYPSKQSLFEDAWERVYELFLRIVDNVAESRPADLEAAVASLILALIDGMQAGAGEGSGDGSELVHTQRAQYELYLWAVRLPEQTKLDNDYNQNNARIAEFLGSYGRNGVDVQFLAELITAIADGLILQILAGSSSETIKKRIGPLVEGLISACTD